mmetsp:Transcript_78324/g.108853  ORF Transcript_78324/g.108853 Transcript_78324/m.108853 type:complete len:238 (-) Transcript_78324:56-769(-)
MLQTASSSDELPLFSSTPQHSFLPMMAMSPLSTSCGAEDRLIIQRQTPSSDSYSFDWSDFPVIQQEDVYGGSFPTPSPSASAMFSSSSRTTSFDSSCGVGSSTCSSTASDSDTEMEEVNARTRKVTFASKIQVRTHTIVLGDHPCCDSLPLELGWEYNDGEVSAAATEAAATKYYTSRTRRRSAARRRSYLERKELLQRVSGMTDDDIKQLVGSQHDGLRHSTSSRSLSSLTMIGDV